MTSAVDRVRKLLALAAGEGEEARTAAHLAAKLIKQHGLVVDIARAAPQARPAPPPQPRRSCVCGVEIPFSAVRCAPCASAIDDFERRPPPGSAKRPPASGSVDFEMPRADWERIIDEFMRAGGGTRR